MSKQPKFPSEDSAPAKRDVLFAAEERRDTEKKDNRSSNNLVLPTVDRSKKPQSLAKEVVPPVVDRSNKPKLLSFDENDEGWKVVS